MMFKRLQKVLIMEVLSEITIRKITKVIIRNKILMKIIMIKKDIKVIEFTIIKVRIII